LNFLITNHVGYLWIFFKPSVSITAASLPENLYMGPNGKTPLVPLFWVGTVLPLDGRNCCIVSRFLALGKRRTVF